jgi:hypothetical protein
MLMLACLAAVSASTLWVAPAEPGAQAEAVNLVYRFVEGKPLVFDQTQEMTSTQTAFGETFTVRSRNGNRTRTDLVERKEDGSLVIANTVERVSFWAKDDEEEVSFDSQKPGDQEKLDDPAIASVALMKDVRVLLHIGPDGSVRGVPNADELMKKAEAMEDPMMAEIARQLWAADSVVAMQEGNLKLLPGKPVRPGDTWNHTIELPFDLGVILMNMTMTLKGVETRDGRSFADIGIAGSIGSRFEPNPEFIMRLDDSKLSGVVRFDVEEGVIDRMQLDSAFTLNIFLPDEAETFASVKFDQKVNQVRVKE